MSMRAAAEKLLQRLTADPQATFRPGQWEAIEQLVERRGRVLVVERTGWGKSAVYFVATKLVRDGGGGPTVLISPLLALMRNQLLMAEQTGIRAATINSANHDDWPAIEAQVRNRALDLLLISPERLNNVRFRDEILPGLVTEVGLLVVDEAHCISDWGHDFRPDYRRIGRVLRLLPPGVGVLCTTATANDRVVDDIVEQLGRDLEVIRGPLERESLALAAVDLADPSQRLAWLAGVIPTMTGSGIIYCLTVADTRRVAGWLRSRGIDAVAYSGDTDNEGRIEVEDALLHNRVKVVVATSALGMGFDKPDLSFVVHYQNPGSPVAYYQQVGRAGRAVEAVAVLLCGREDTDIQDWFIRTAFPPREQAERVVALLEANRPASMSVADIELEVNARRSRIEAMLKVLEVDGAVERSGRGWRRSGQSWSYDEDRAGRVTALRRTEQAAMADYAGSAGCRMAFLRRQLDDPVVAPCGRCDNCTGRRWDIDLDRGVVADALAYLRGAALEIEPRRQWPSGLVTRRGRIPADHLLGPGRALSGYGDGGWGATVESAATTGARYPDELVDAAAELVRTWRPEPAPRWVTCVPSAAPDATVDDFARRLARALALDFCGAVHRVRTGRPQAEMANSAQQVGNVDGAFEVAAPFPTGPVLLVDDTVDSRWTLTAVGVALRRAGSGPVHPFVLARAGGG